MRPEDGDGHSLMSGSLYVLAGAHAPKLATSSTSASGDAERGATPGSRRACHPVLAVGAVRGSQPSIEAVPAHPGTWKRLFSMGALHAADPAHGHQTSPWLKRTLQTPTRRPAEDSVAARARNIRRKPLSTLTLACLPSSTSASVDMVQSIMLSTRYFLCVLGVLCGEARRAPASSFPPASVWLLGWVNSPTRHRAVILLPFFLTRVCGTRRRVVASSKAQRVPTACENRGWSGIGPAPKRPSTCWAAACRHSRSRSWRSDDVAAGVRGPVLDRN